MDFERWNRVKDIVNACRELKPQERKEHILVASGGEPDLIAEVESLLSDEKTGEFSEPPLPDTEAPLDPPPPPQIGQTWGPSSFAQRRLWFPEGTIHELIETGENCVFSEEPF